MSFFLTITKETNEIKEYPLFPLIIIISKKHLIIHFKFVTSYLTESL